MASPKVKKEEDGDAPSASAILPPAARVSLESSAQRPSGSPSGTPSRHFFSTLSPSPLKSCKKEDRKPSAKTRVIPSARNGIPAVAAAAAKKDEDTSESGEDMPPSQLSFNLTQITLSQADEHIQRLEKQGQLNEVVGSQSLLSQELLCSSQREEVPFPESEPTQDYFPQTESSLSMAQRLGLLGKEDENSDGGDRKESVLGLSTPTKTLQAGLEKALSSPHGFEFEDSQLSHVSLEEAAAVKSLQMVSASSPNRTPTKESGGRFNECFGSLLDAVKIITDQEGVDPTVYALGDEKMSDASETSKKLFGKDEKDKKPKATGTKRKAPETGPASITPSEKAEKKSRKTNVKKKDEEQKKAQETAKRAAALAEQTVADPEMAKRLLLSMALVRENPRTAPASWPARGSVVKEGFFWAHYPPLESVLKKHMETYYELSTTKCQSAQQQKFNNDLVILIREVAKEQEWTFDTCFNDKSLRDRIRCYYKTHIQNAKKRLRTMVRNPTKKANARHLCAHLDLIQQHNEMTASESGNENVAGEVMVPPSAAAQSSANCPPARRNSSRSNDGCETDSTLTDTEVRQIIARKKRVSKPIESVSV